MRRDFVPAPTDVLCERCGYVLNGLPDTGNCPECGLPVAESTVASPRRLPAWETGTDHPGARFWATARFVLSAPKQFFRTLQAHGDPARSRRFGLLAIAPGILLSAKAVLMHYAAVTLAMSSGSWLIFPVLLVAAPAVAAGGWIGLHLLVVRLTNWEANYWGFRLPADVVRRACHYLAAQATLSVALPWLITLVYLCWTLAHTEKAAIYLTAYLYTLSGAVVISAVYLFYVYVAAMKSLMYANR